MAAVAAGSGYDARSLPFGAPAGTWSAGQWGQYQASGYPSNGLQDTLATQQDLNNGMYLTSFQNSVSAQALGQVPPRRKCGRPKAPNPLDDPNIPEKKARRIMANRASADRSKQRAKLAAAQAKAEVAAFKTQLSDVSRQLTDTDDCLTVLELVQCAIGGLPAPQGALYSLKQQLGSSRDRFEGKAGSAPEQRGMKRKLQAMQNFREQPRLPDFSEGMAVQPVLQPQQQQEPQDLPQAAAWQAVQLPAMGPGASSASPVAATAACVTQGPLASQLSVTTPVASAALMYDAPMASSVNVQKPPQQQQKALDVLAALTKMLDPLQQTQQQGQRQQQGRGWQQLMPLAADGMQHRQQQQSAALTMEQSRTGVSDLEQLLQQLVSKVVRS